MDLKTIAIAGLSCLGLSACSKNTLAGTDAGMDSGVGTVIDAGRYTLTVLGPGTPDTTCDPHATPDGGIEFSNVTSDWGIAADGGLPLEATTLVAADLDGDGYPDLIAINGFNAFPSGRETIPTVMNGKLQNLYDGGLSFSIAVLMNRPKPDGGRMFVDNTEASGLAQIRGGSSTQFRDISIAAVGDIDNNGTLDVLTAIVNPPLDGGNIDVPEVLLNDGTGRFTLAPQSDFSHVGWDWFPQGLTLTDVDNDGHLDAYEAFWFDNNHTWFGSQQQLYQGNGDGSFTSVTQATGLERANYDGPPNENPPSAAIKNFIAGKNSHPAIGVTVCDLNGDGYPELVESSYGQQWNTLYQNDGTGASFIEVAQDAGYAGDNNRDYHDNQYFVCWCSVNKGNSDCAGVPRPQIQCPTPAGAYWDPVLGETAANLNGNGFTTVCREMFGSGMNDLYVANIKHWWDGQSIDPSNLLENVTPAGGGILFNRIDNATDKIQAPHDDPEGWNEGLLSAAAVDLDNDGRPDLLVGATDYAYQRALLFMQNGDRTFTEDARDAGMNFPCADGFAVADFDRDGDLDVIIGASLERQCVDPPSMGGGAYTTAVVQMFSNNASQSSKWLEIRLRGDGVTTNSMGIGARVTLTVNGTEQMQEMQSNFGHVSIGDDIGMLFWGLGDCANVDSITVRWPNKSLSVDTYSNVAAGHIIELRQGDPTVYGVNLP